MRVVEGVPLAAALPENTAEALGDTVVTAEALVKTVALLLSLLLRVAFCDAEVVEEGDAAPETLGERDSFELLVAIELRVAVPLLQGLPVLARLAEFAALALTVTVAVEELTRDVVDNAETDAADEPLRDMAVVREPELLKVAQGEVLLCGDELPPVVTVLDELGDAELDGLLLLCGDNEAGIEPEELKELLRVGRFDALSLEDEVVLADARVDADVLDDTESLCDERGEREVLAERLAESVAEGEDVPLIEEDGDNDRREERDESRDKVAAPVIVFTGVEDVLTDA